MFFKRSKLPIKEAFKNDLKKGIKNNLFLGKKFAFKYAFL